MKRFIYLTKRLHNNLIRSYSSSLATCQDVPFSEQPTMKLKHLEKIHEFIGGNPERIKNTLSSYMKLQLLEDIAVYNKLNVIRRIEGQRSEIRSSVNYFLQGGLIISSLLKDVSIILQPGLILGMQLSDQYSLKIIQLLNYNALLLRNRYKVLHEFGFTPYKISTYHIRRCISICKSSVSKLKKKEFIDKDEKVLENLWLAAGLDLNSCPSESDSSTLYNLKEIALEAYLKGKIGIPDNEFAANKEQMIYRMKNKSFETMNANYHIFKNIIGLSERRIQTNWFVLFCDPLNVMDLLNRIQEVANVDMKIILHLYPKVAIMPSGNLEKIVEYIEAENIPIHFAEKRLDIFTLNCENVRQRLADLKKEEFFSLNIKNPRIIELVFYQVKAKKRLEILEELKVQPTVASLATTEENFESYCETGAKHYTYDTLPYIASELDLTQKAFITKIRRHNRWHLVPLVHVGRNLQKLRKNFSDEEIKKYIYILFYFSEKLNSALRKLDSYEGFEDFKENGAIKKDYVLPLALYFLEKESNFTGDSIWDQEDVNPYQDLPDIPVQNLKSKPD